MARTQGKTNAAASEFMLAGYNALPASPIRPMVAVKALIKLIKNKEDTTQVFKISEALSGNSHNRLFERFANSPYGKRVIEEPIEFEKTLSNFDRLRVLPEGSFGRVYLDFMESGGLTPDGLIDVAEDSGVALRENDYPEYSRTFMHMETTHDVWHVITGYNRDALGEQCLLEVTRILTYNRAFSLITFIGGLVAKKEMPSLPIGKIKREAVKNAKLMAWLPEIDFEELLPLPLDEVRAKLNVMTPVKYNAVPQEVKDKLLKPANDRAEQNMAGIAAE